jgi:hypothetical protein
MVVVQILTTFFIKTNMAVHFHQFALAASLHENFRFNSDSILPHSSSGYMVYFSAARTYLGLVYESSKSYRHKKRIYRFHKKGCPKASRRYAFLGAQERAVGNKETLNDDVVFAGYEHAFNCLAGKR